MPKPGNVSVTTEVGYCPFCGRTRNLRREDRKLGQLVRTTVECESCHRTLSSTMGPVLEEPAKEPAPVTAEPESAAAPPPARREATKTAPAKKPATAASKPAAAATKPAAAAKKPAAKKAAATRKKA